MTGAAALRSRRAGRVPTLAVASLLAACTAAGGAQGRTSGAAGAPACPPASAGAAFTARVTAALASGRDAWGDALLRSRSGPTYERVAGLLPPLLYARGPRRAAQTASGVYYLPFGRPAAGGGGTVPLHVADGSEIVSGRAGGAHMTVSVGAAGRERYGSCLARLATPRLAEGYLPILQTRYRDAAGTAYRQESFAAQGPGGTLVSFVRVAVRPRPGAGAATVRFDPGARGLRLEGDRLVRNGRTLLWASGGGRLAGGALTFSIPAGRARVVYAARPLRPAPNVDLVLDASAYERARSTVVDFWRARLAAGAELVVPERRVLDAERSLLIQNLQLAWRYSVGNSYEAFSFPESLDDADVIGEYGFGAVQRTIVRAALRRPPARYPAWETGMELASVARAFRLGRDPDVVEQTTPVLRRRLRGIGRELAASPRHLLEPERWAADLGDVAYTLNGQAVVLEGLREMADAWARTGHAADAARAQALAGTLAGGLHAAVRASARRLPDGSLFVPVRLLAGDEPYDRLTATKPGSYWNLVMPYALASGLFAPGGAEATGILRYLDTHGSRFLGLVRAGGYSLYGEAATPGSATDAVYDLHMAQFLADNHQADRLVLSLYGALAAGMARGTFVAGEAATVAPLAGRRFRSMFLPPNSTANAAFLETLRLLLVHETRDAAGLPAGLELAFGTPRAWLAPGKRIEVHDAPTSFGPLSYTLAASRGSVTATVDVPPDGTPRPLDLRLRLPPGVRATSLAVGGLPSTRLDRRSGTIHLAGLTGSVELTVETSAGSGAP